MRAIARTMGGLGAIATGLALAAPAFAASLVLGALLPLPVSAWGHFS